MGKEREGVPVMQPYHHWNGQVALLAGGRSGRMEGADKGLLEWRGRPLWKHQVETADAIGARRRWLLRRHDQAGLWSPPDGWELLEDEPGCQHPMQAVLALLRRLVPDDGPVLVLPVDMPRIDAGWLRERLLPAISDGRGAVFVSEGLYQPLVACYTKAMIPLLERQVERGDFRWQQVIRNAVAEDLLAVVEIGAGEASRRFMNVNRPSDWQQLQGSEQVRVVRLSGPDGGRDKVRETDDEVAVEGPLEIRVAGRPVAVVMRTPGHDEELAAGFLVSEGVVRERGEVFEISGCPSHRKQPDREEGSEWRSVDEGAVIDVLLTRGGIDFDELTRHVFAASSCGICGKATIDAVLQRQTALPKDGLPVLRREVLTGLPEKLRSGQAVFDRTGGLHAAGLFDFEGNLLHLREDVGRHNAVDKLLGRLLLDDRLPAHDLLLMVSGRVSFEIMQKALAAGLPVVAAVSAPTSLAIDFAQRSRQTLVAFVRNGRANVYAGRVES